MKNERNSPRLNKTTTIITIAIIALVATQSLQANLVSTHIANGQYGLLNTSVSTYIDPSITNWVAWHDQTSPTVVGGNSYVGSYTWIGVDDYFTLTITNPSGTSLTKLMDYNDGMGVSSGPQAVIFGTAAVAPDVKRWSPYVGYSGTFDEAGVFDSIFTTAGTYTFSFYGGNTGSTVIGYPDMYLLVDEISYVPVPSAVLLCGIGMGIAGLRLRKRQTSSK
jgi:hypothetical protein